jgi:hypothetical protein
MKTLRTCYNLAFNPASWDCIPWLVNVEMARVRHGYDNFTVYFKPGPKDGFRDDTLERSLEQRRMILENVIKPALCLFNAEESKEECSLLFQHMFREVVRGYKNGEAIPKLKIPKSARKEAAAYLKGRKPLIITLREAEHYIARNSDVGAWLSFARDCGEDVIFVRDTAKADEPLYGFETCPRASRDFLFRGALMEQAKCNLLVCNGPVGFCWFSSTPYLLFKPFTPELPDYRPGQPDWWRDKIGIEPYGQCVFSSPQQRIVWKPDTVEAIRGAWAEMNEKLAA